MVRRNWRAGRGRKNATAQQQELLDCGVADRQWDVPLAAMIMGANAEQVAENKEIGGLHSALNDRRIDVAEAMLKLGADPNFRCRIGTYGKIPPLHLAVVLNGTDPITGKNDALSIAAVDILVAAGGDINARDDFGNTVLERAVKNGQLEMADHLLVRGADPNMQDDQSLTPLHWAVQMQNREMTRLLLKGGANPALTGLDGMSALDIARKLGLNSLVTMMKTYSPSIPQR